MTTTCWRRHVVRSDGSATLATTIAATNSLVANLVFLAARPLGPVLHVANGLLRQGGLRLSPGLAATLSTRHG